MRTRLATLVMFLCVASASHAQDSKDKDKEKAKAVHVELDKSAAIAAYNAAVIGTELFNNDKNYEGCYRVYQGALIGLLPAIDHHPELVVLVRDKMSKAKSLPFGEGAGVLREALEEIQNLNRPKKTLWDRIGGELVVRSIVHDFVVSIANDKNVNVTRDGKFKLDAEGVKKLEQLLVEQISAASGGPFAYKGRDMKATHAGMKITEAEFNAARNAFIFTLARHKVPDKERAELREIIEATRKDIVEVPGDAPKKGSVPKVNIPPSTATGNLWERLGGETKVRAIVHDFVTEAAFDPKVNLTRSGKYELNPEVQKNLEERIVEHISVISDGPLKPKIGDVKKTLATMKFTKDEFNTMGRHFNKALGQHKVPQVEQTQLMEKIGAMVKEIAEDK